MCYLDSFYHAMISEQTTRIIPNQYGQYLHSRIYDQFNITNTTAHMTRIYIDKLLIPNEDDSGNGLQCVRFIKESKFNYVGTINPCIMTIHQWDYY